MRRQLDRTGRQVGDAADAAASASPPGAPDAPGAAGTRSKASTPSTAGSQVIGPSPSAADTRRMRSASWYSRSIESSLADSASTVRSRHSLGCGSHGSRTAPGGEKPNGGSVPDHGSGTRLPSRPGSAP